MQEEHYLRLILGSMEFLIPSNFPSFDDVNPHIQSILISTGHYIVKSNVTKVAFQSFLDHWVYNETPNITFDNFDDYYYLSQEFDRMNDIISMFKVLLPNSNCSYIQKKNQNLINKRDERVYKLNDKTRRFHLIIDHLFNNNGIDSYQRFSEIKSELYEACLKEKYRIVDMLTKKIVNHESGFSFVINEDKKTAGIFKLLTKESNILIPRSINYNCDEYLVTVIHESAFFHSNISDVTFEENSEVKIIEKLAFCGSNIMSITIPKHVVYIGKYCFFNCSELCEVCFVENSEIEVIESNAFSDSEIDELSIPSSIQIFRNGWCYDLSKLNNIKVYPSENENVIFYDNKFLIEKSINSNDFDRLIFACRSIKEAEIPSFVKIIESYAFEKCKCLQTVTFSENSQLEIIESNAFSESSIQKVVFPDSVIKIGYNCFYDCDQLETVEFSKNSKLNTIGENAFSNFQMQKRMQNRFDYNEYMNMYNSTRISNQTPQRFFRPNSLFNSIKNLSIPSSVVDFRESWCSSTTSLINITILPNEIENIRLIESKIIVGKSDIYKDEFDVILFAARDIENVVIPSCIKIISSYAFAGCYCIQKVEFSEDSQLEVIENNAFYESTIKSITIPQHVIEIGESAFSECFYLTEVKFHENSELKIIGSHSFFHSNIQKIEIPSTVEKLGERWCDEISTLTTISVMPQNENYSFFDEKFLIGKSDKLSQKFDTILFIKHFINKIEIPSFIKYISPSVFYKNKQLCKINFHSQSQLFTIEDDSFNSSIIEEITIPPSVTRIGKRSFYNCNNLRTINFLPNSNLKIIDESAFYNSGIKSIFIPRKVLSIERDAFNRCSKLKSIQFEENSELESIGPYSFFYSGIENIFIPSSVIKIDENAFANCNRLKIVEFSNDSKLKKIANSAFSEALIENISIPSHVSQIEEGAFRCCKQLTNIKFDENSEIRILNHYAFVYTAIESFLVPSSVTFIGKSTFGNCYNLNKVEFTEDSKLQLMSEGPFSNSNIESLSIPSNFSGIQNGIFAETPNLNTIKLLSFNKNSILFNDGEFIFGKSNPCNENYDVLVFARRDINEVIIPSFIKYIAPSAFEDCKYIDTVDLSKLNIKVLNKKTFSKSSIKSVKISVETEKICENCFSGCKDLKSVEFDINSKLTIIEYNAFCKSSISSILIPANVKELGQSAFSKCKKLKKIEFTESSELCKIGMECFNKTKITSFSVPANVSSLDSVFIDCYDLKIIEINENSKIKEIENCIFGYYSNKKIIMIPVNLKETLKMVNERYNYNFDFVS